MRPRDSQRSKIYKWEGIHVKPHGDHYHKLDLNACGDLAKCACERYGARPPIIKDGRGRRTAAHFSDGGDGFIALPKWSRTRWVVLHESAHAIAGHILRWRNARGTEPGHGPTFARVYIDLASHFLHIPLPALRKSATAAKIKVAVAATCAPLPFKDQVRVVCLDERIAKLAKELTEARHDLAQTRAAAVRRWETAALETLRAREKRSEAARARFQESNPFENGKAENL